MNYAVVENANLNHGKPTTLYYPIPFKHFKYQVTEILEAEQYKAGRIKCDTLVDIGANIGMASLYFKDYAKHIYAVEPSPECYEALVLNTKSYPKIKTYQLAISSNCDKMPLYTDNDGTVPQTIYPYSPTAEILVDAVDFPTFMERAGINHIDIMKIDTEGAEYVIFPSLAFQKVVDKIDLIVGELHFVARGFPDAVMQILSEYGFKTEYIQTNPKNFVRLFNYNESWSGYSHQWEIGYDTIFVARRK